MPDHILAIVESPTKVKTISRFVDKNFTVLSSFGHVRDLPGQELGVEIEKGFKPTYVLLPRTRKLLPALKAAADKSKWVYLATDHDREGESIAWHLVEILGLPPEKIRRITFHEITASAIQESLKAPRAIDMNLVSAQQARRVLDRLVGYKLSPLLWSKIKKGLSAGRVQSVALRLVVERKHEMENFKTEAFWRLSAELEKKGFPPFEAQLVRWKGEKVEATQTHKLFSEDYRVGFTCFKTAQQMQAVVEMLSGSKYEVLSVEAKDLRRKPQPPFVTSSLQQDASRRLGFSSERTMRIAQGLYEGVALGQEVSEGLITYMRTDSFSVARAAQEEARKLVLQEFGQTYLPEAAPVYKTKAKGAQEAHEAIRPTSVFRKPQDVAAHLSGEQLKLYELIWTRFVASQMAEARYHTLGVDVGAGEAVFRANGRTLVFAGYLKVYGKAESDDKDADSELPPLAQGDDLRLVKLNSQEHHTSPPPHYNEASLIRAMEKHGIGRPSTYAPTIKTVVERGYVRIEGKDRKILATDLGVLVTAKLKDHFKDVVSLTYTAEVEEFLDKVAEGETAWQKVVSDFYEPFAKALDKARVDMKEDKVVPKESAEKCPKCGKSMLLRESRYGQYLSCSNFPRCKGKIPLSDKGEKMVPTPTNESCNLCGKPMVIRSGRRGRFLACSGYPACKNTFSLDADGNKVQGSQPVVTARLCNKCQRPLWLRQGKRGPFLACSGFPRCRNLISVSREEAETIRAGGPAPAAPAVDGKPPAEAAAKKPARPKKSAVSKKKPETA
ncbi:MAG: DNA topoisomerase I [Elusimicrobia bacterium RIFCSPLOWO2_12_FULL_59_9]|nr:MAG: DNA topoisomerase I [Elusimicrobia bacterium RIFCSPLOWO2_12_FULL_59_9]